MPGHCSQERCTLDGRRYSHAVCCLPAWEVSIVTPFFQLLPVTTVLVAVPVYHETIDLLRELALSRRLAPASF